MAHSTDDSIAGGPSDSEAPDASLQEPSGPGDVESLRERLRSARDGETDAPNPIQTALRLGTEYFDVENGYLIHIDPATGDHRIAEVGRPDVGADKGLRSDLKDTYCRVVVAEGGPVAVENAAEQGWADDPAYDTFGLACYLGMKVVVNGELYGTVCFAGPSPREQPFGEKDRAALGLIAQTIEQILEQRRQAAETERLRQKYQGVLEGAPDAILVSRAEAGTIVEANQAAASLLDAPTDEIEGRPLGSFFPSGTDTRRRALLDRARETDDTLEATTYADGTEIRLETATGQQVPVEVRTTRVTLWGETFIVGTFRDISERKQKTKTLRQRTVALERRESRLRGLANSVPGTLFQFEVAPDGSYALDFVSQKVESLLGLSSEPEGFFERLVERVPAPYQHEFLASIEAAIEQEAQWDFEMPVDRPGGDRIWVRGISTPERRPTGDGDDRLLFHGIVIDVTERKRHEQQLRQREAALDRAGEAVLITEAAPLDPPGPRITYVNDAFEAMTGYAEDEVVGETPRLLQGPKTEREVLDRLRRALEAGREWEGETINYRKDGTPYVVHWKVTPVRDDTGEIHRWVSVQRDVTDERQREQTLRRAKEAAETARDKAEEASRLKSTMLANMSHELRTPLTSIIGFAEAIVEDVDPENSQTHRFARLIEESGRRLMDTLSGVLNLSKLEAGEMDVAAEPVDLTAEADSAVERMEPHAQKAGVSLSVETDAPVWAEADEKGIELVLNNLLSNALKYTESGGQVQVRTHQKKGHAVLEVEDTGIGMDPAEVNRLFDAFKQGSEGLSREYEGSGLGLSIVDKLTKQMDGTIDVETAKGEGSRLSIRLPRATPSADAPRSEVPHASSQVSEARPAPLASSTP